MSLKLYAHPFSSYCQKVLIALYENGTPFELRMLAPDHPDTLVELEALWPLKRFPVLVDGGRTVLEASIIIEHLQLRHPGPVRLIPDEPCAALEVRMLDRIFDNYVANVQAGIVRNALRPTEARDASGVAQSRHTLETIYRWLDRHMLAREWAAGDRFSLADCAAAPALFYGDWSHKIDAALTNLTAYRRRLLARPSFARAVAEARPYRSLFPLGAPDRD